MTRWLTMLAVVVLAGFWLKAEAQTIQTAPSMSGPWSNAAVLAGSQGFARLVGPNGRSTAIGSVLTVTNSQAGTLAPPAAVLSNGTLTVTAGIASNSLNQIDAMSSTNLALKLTLVGQ